MPSPPFPVTATNVDDLKKQVMQLIRVVYEEKLGGATVGDVFEIPGDTLELKVGNGFTKQGNKLDVARNPKSIQSISGSLKTIGLSDTLTLGSSCTEVAGAFVFRVRAITVSNGLITNVGAET